MVYSEASASIPIEFNIFEFSAKCSVKIYVLSAGKTSKMSFDVKEKVVNPTTNCGKSMGNTKNMVATKAII